MRWGIKDGRGLRNWRQSATTKPQQLSTVAEEVFGVSLVSSKLFLISTLEFFSSGNTFAIYISRRAFNLSHLPLISSSSSSQNVYQHITWSQLLLFSWKQQQKAFHPGAFFFSSFLVVNILITFPWFIWLRVSLQYFNFLQSYDDWSWQLSTKISLIIHIHTSLCTAHTH